MQRGWSSFADTRQKPIATSSIRTRVFSFFSRRCVGGDVHPVGVRRRLHGSRIFGRCSIVTISLAQPGRVSAEAGACGAERNQPASKSRHRTSTALGFGSSDGWILREAGEERVFSTEAGMWSGRGFSGRKRRIRKSGRRFSLSPQARRNDPRNTGTLIRGSGGEFSRSGDECFRDFTPIHMNRGRQNIFRGLTRLTRDRTRDRFSTTPRNAGTIFHDSRRDFQTAS